MGSAINKKAQAAAQRILDQAVAERAIPAWTRPLEALMNHPAIRRACIPASNGLMNARSIACHYAALIGDGFEGVRLLREETLAEALRLRPIPGVERPEDPGRGLGYAFMGPSDAPASVFGHGGYGGSTGYADRRHCLAVGVAKARTNGGGVADEAVRAVRAGLGIG